MNGDDYTQESDFQPEEFGSSELEQLLSGISAPQRRSLSDLATPETPTWIQILSLLGQISPELRPFTAPITTGYQFGQERKQAKYDVQARQQYGQMKLAQQQQRAAAQQAAGRDRAASKVIDIYNSLGQDFAESYATNSGIREMFGQQPFPETTTVGQKRKGDLGLARQRYAQSIEEFAYKQSRDNLSDVHNGLDGLLTAYDKEIGKIQKKIDAKEANSQELTQYDTLRKAQVKAISERAQLHNLQIPQSNLLEMFQPEKYGSPIYEQPSFFPGLFGKKPTLKSGRERFGGAGRESAAPELIEESEKKKKGKKAINKKTGPPAPRNAGPDIYNPRYQPPVPPYIPSPTFGPYPGPRAPRGVYGE